MTSEQRTHIFHPETSKALRETANTLTRKFHPGSLSYSHFTVYFFCFYFYFYLDHSSDLLHLEQVFSTRQTSSDLELKKLV